MIGMKTILAVLLIITAVVVAINTIGLLIKALVVAAILGGLALVIRSLWLTKDSDQ